MHNIAEEITGEWLRHIKKCEFVEYNVKGPHQTEIDVIGLNIINKEIYVCEVAAHIHGLQYVDPQKRLPIQKTVLFTNLQKTKNIFNSILTILPSIICFGVPLLNLPKKAQNMML